MTCWNQANFGAEPASLPLTTAGPVALTQPEGHPRTHRVFGDVGKEGAHLQAGRQTHPIKVESAQKLAFDYDSLTIVIEVAVEAVGTHHQFQLTTIGFIGSNVGIKNILRPAGVMSIVVAVPAQRPQVTGQASFTEGHRNKVYDPMN